jgi:hypothetical protein
MPINAADDIERRLRKAFTRYKAAIGINQRCSQAWDATRKLLIIVLEYWESRSYADFVAGIKTNSARISNSRIDEYLAAAKFACQRSLVIDGIRKRIIDLPKDVPCPTVTAMARANSLLASKDRRKQLLGRRRLLNALNGKLSNTDKGHSGEENGTIKLSLSELNVSSPEAMILMALFIASGDRGKERVTKIAKIVESGGTLNLRFGGSIRRKFDPNPRLASRISSRTLQLALQGLECQKETNAVEESDYYDERIKKQGASLLQARRDRIKLRDKLLSSITNNAANRVFTSRGTVGDMLRSVMTAWEGPDNFSFADVVAEDFDDAMLQLCAALEALKRDLHEKRVGILVFPREPVGAIEERLVVNAGERLVDKMMRLNAVEICDQLHRQFPSLPRRAVEVCIKDALDLLRRKIKSEPSEVEVVQEAQIVLQQLRPNAVAQSSLMEAHKRLSNTFPGLKTTRLNMVVANSAERLRSKFHVEPSVQLIIWEAERSITGRRK